MTLPVAPKPQPLPVAPPQAVAPAPKPEAPAAPAKPQRTALQRHVDFFDRNHDRTITRAETQEGLQAIGMGKVSSFLASFGIHLGLTRTVEKGHDIDTAKIHTTKHDSDTDAFDEAGHRNADKVAKLMAFDADRSGNLNWAELKAMIQANKETTAGSLASVAEFGLLLRLGADATDTVKGKAKPALSRARLESVYDGSLFEKLAAEKAAKAR